jgi:hypothetical protein
MDIMASAGDFYERSHDVPGWQDQPTFHALRTCLAFQTGVNPAARFLSLIETVAMLDFRA